MIAALAKILSNIDTWPEEDQAALVDYARELEAGRNGIYHLTDAEWKAVQEGLAQSERGELASDDEVVAANKRYGI
jgi:predicted transcriptional regulator